MIAEFFTHYDRARQPHVLGGLVNVYNHVHPYGPVPIPNPDTLLDTSLLNNQIKTSRNPAETLKRRLILLYLIPILLEVAYHMLKQILLWLRLALCFTTRPLSPLALTVIYCDVEKAFDQ